MAGTERAEGASGADSSERNSVGSGQMMEGPASHSGDFGLDSMNWKPSEGLEGGSGKKRLQCGEQTAGAAGTQEGRK